MILKLLPAGLSAACTVCFSGGSLASGALGWVLLLAGAVFVILTVLVVTIIRIEKFRGTHGHL